MVAEAHRGPTNTIMRKNRKAQLRMGLSLCVFICYSVYWISMDKHQHQLVAAQSIMKNKKASKLTSAQEEDDAVPSPKFVLDSDKYLIPLLYNGPNNQMIGFQQSILLAVLLNRFVELN